MAFLFIYIYFFFSVLILLVSARCSARSLLSNSMITSSSLGFLRLLLVRILNCRCSRLLNLFLTMCSVRVPWSILETLAHLLPTTLTASTSSMSSLNFHTLRMGLGSRWLIQCSRHCLAVLKYRF